MRITEIRVAAFRNLTDLTLCPHARLNLLWGENGQGKTNLLEALYVALRGRSFRPYAHRPDWLPTSGRGLALELAIEDAQGYSSRVRLISDAQGKALRYFLNEKRRSPGEVQERYPVVAFSPDDDSLVRGGPEERRNYLDMVYGDVCPGYGATLQRYEHVLKSRNVVLRALRDGDGSRREELATWTTLLVKQGLELAQLRQELWPEFTRRLADWAGSEAASLLRPRATYESDLEAHGVQGAEAYAQLLKTSEAADIATGWTHRGPHRDELRLLILDNLDARGRASQGQARLLALGLKWLHAQWIRDFRGEEALLLVDDFSSELDVPRRTQIISLISNTSSQIFISSTERNLVDSPRNIEYTNYHVKNGQITV